MLNYQASVEFDFNHENSDCDLSETAEVIVEYGSKSAILEEANAFDSEPEGPYMVEALTDNIVSSNAAEKYKRPTRGSRRYKIDLYFFQCCIRQVLQLPHQFEKDEWKRLADGLSDRNDSTKMLSYRDELYAFPSAGKGERYDPVVNGWCTLDLSTTWSTKVAVVRGEIYAIEVSTSTRKSTIKRCNIERCSWQTVLSSHQGCREESCVVAAGNHLYVCGGRKGNDFFTKAERFDTVENKWEEIANMQQKRGCAFGVATEGKIFVAGGQKENWGSCLKTCEMFNISTNDWQFIGSLTADRMLSRMVCLKGTLYVLGGTSNSCQSKLSVECYDPSEDKWIEKTTIPVKMISKNNKDAFTGCVVKLSKGVLDKLDVVNK